MASEEKAHFFVAFILPLVSKINSYDADDGCYDELGIQQELTSFRCVNSSARSSSVPFPAAADPPLLVGDWVLPLLKVGPPLAIAGAILGTSLGVITCKLLVLVQPTTTMKL